MAWRMVASPAESYSWPWIGDNRGGRRPHDGVLEGSEQQEEEQLVQVESTFSQMKPDEEADEDSRSMTPE